MRRSLYPDEVAVQGGVGHTPTRPFLSSFWLHYKTRVHDALAVRSDSPRSPSGQCHDQPPRNPLSSLPVTALPKGDHCPGLRPHVLPEQLDFIRGDKCEGGRMPAGAWRDVSHSPGRGEDSGGGRI